MARVEQAFSLLMSMGRVSDTNRIWSGRILTPVPIVGKLFGKKCKNVFLESSFFMADEKLLGSKSLHHPTTDGWSQSSGDGLVG